MLTTIRDITPYTLNWKRVYGMSTTIVHSIFCDDLETYEIKFLAKVKDNKAYLVAEVKSFCHIREVTIDFLSLLDKPVIKVAELIIENDNDNFNDLSVTQICIGIKKVIEYFAVKQAEIHKRFLEAEESLKGGIAVSLYINDHKKKISLKLNGKSFVEAHEQAKNLGYLEDTFHITVEDEEPVDYFSISSVSEYPFANA